MDEALNISEVQRGVTSKRGESGKAVQMKLSEANVPLDDMRRDDELVLEDMLYCTLIDLGNPYILRPDQARDMLGADTPDAHVKAIYRRPIKDSIKSVEVLPGTLRPKAPGEHREEVIVQVEAQVIDAELGQWEMDNRGISINTLLRLSRRKQRTEIDMLINGQDAPVVWPDDDNYHMREIQEFVASSHWLVLDENARQRIDDHNFEHFKQHLAKAQGDQLTSGEAPPNQGSPPAEAAQAAAEMSPGLVGSAVNVA